jgi:hypothetical protein
MAKLKRFGKEVKAWEKGVKTGIVPSSSICRGH